MNLFLIRPLALGVGRAARAVEEMGLGAYSNH